MNLAVIRTGGKQYLVSPGQKIKIEKINTSEGEEVVFDDVLLLANDAASTEAMAATVELGRPKVEGAQVKGKVIRQGKGKKVIVFKYKAKKRYKVKKGHRQPFSEVEIKTIDHRP